MTTDERLENLERELTRAKRRNRWLVVGLAVVGVALAWTITKSTSGTQTREAAKEPKNAQVIRATAFVLVDDEGRERGKLEMGENGPSLDLYDETGKTRAMLAAGKDLAGSALCLYDDKGKSYSVLLFEGGLFLRDENGKLRAGLNVSGGQASLELNDARTASPPP